MRLAPRPTLSHPLLLALALAAAGCSRTAASPTLVAALPVVPGEAWDDARSALARLDPAVRDLQGLGGRTAIAKAELVLAGQKFEEVSIAGVASRPSVRTVRVAAPSPGDRCDEVRDALVRALGPDWVPGEKVLGAVTVTNGPTRSARIVCNGAELSVSIVG